MRTGSAARHDRAGAIAWPSSASRSLGPAASALLHRPPPHRPPLQSESELHDPHLLLLQRPILQSESELQPPHLPLAHRPLPLQSESELQPPHLPLAHRPSEQSESELQPPHRLALHRPWPLQSESELQAPQRPLAHRPTPAQSESELQLPARAGRAATPSSALNATTMTVTTSDRTMRRGYARRRPGATASSRP
jgi:hypothetical protein